MEEPISRTMIVGGSWESETLTSNALYSLEANWVFDTLSEKETVIDALSEKETVNSTWRAFSLAYSSNFVLSSEMI
jgi:hypothetical protein